MKTAIIDIRTPNEAERALLKLGFSVLRAPPSKKLPAPLASHPDMLMCIIGKTLVSSADYVDEALTLFDDLAHQTALNFTVTADEFGDVYPRDCIFNALTVGKRLFCKTDSVSPSVIEVARRQGFKTVHVNQGYPACTVLPLGDGAAITADKGMARVLEREGIDVTLIENGGISLPPYEYGFIGGAAGVFDGRVYFLGDPEKHACADLILGAVERAGLRAVSLIDSPLLDLGRILFADQSVDDHDGARDQQYSENAEQRIRCEKQNEADDGMKP